ncbi:hypothetical protein GCM10027299_16070 [Larkinella ripae]
MEAKTIIINETEAGHFTDFPVNTASLQYWNLENQYINIEPEEFVAAQEAGLTYIEFVVEDILKPKKVKLNHQFIQKAVPALAENVIVMGNRVLDGIAYTDIQQSVQLAGEDTIFKFWYPIDDLLSLQPEEEAAIVWNYTLCKKQGNVFLVVFYFKNAEEAQRGTVSCGVKIPKGRS